MKMLFKGCNEYYPKQYLPDFVLHWIKVIYPKYCWASLVIWNMGNPEYNIFHPIETSMFIGGCDHLVKEKGSGWCGHCKK